MAKGDRGLEGFEPNLTGRGLLVLHWSFGSWLWRSGKVLHLKAVDSNLGVVGLLVLENKPNSCPLVLPLLLRCFSVSLSVGIVVQKALLHPLPILISLPYFELKNGWE